MKVGFDEIPRSHAIFSVYKHKQIFSCVRFIGADVKNYVQLCYVRRKMSYALWRRGCKQRLSAIE
jgi:hypothetical protein